MFPISSFRASLSGLVRRANRLYAHPVFLDEAIIDGSLEETTALWLEFLSLKRLVQIDSQPEGALTQFVADPRSECELLLKRAPKLVGFSLDALGPRTTRLRVQARPGAFAGRIALLCCALLPATLNAILATCLLERCLVAQPNFASMAGLVAVFAACFVSAFWLIEGLGAGGSVLPGFNRFLASSTPLRLFVVRAVWYSSSKLCAFLLQVLGFAFVIGQISATVAVIEPSPGTNIPLLWGMLSLFAVVFISTPLTPRWIVGMDAFLASTTLAMHNLLPFITAVALAVLIRRSGTVSGSGVVAIAFIAAFGCATALAFLVLGGIGGFVSAKEIDFWRARTEAYRNHTAFRRAMLLPVLVTCCLSAGLLFIFTFIGGVLFLQARFLGEYRLVDVPLGYFVATAVVEKFIARMSDFVGLPINARFAANCLWVCHFAPVLFWGGSHILFSVSEVWHHIGLCSQRQPTLVPGKARKAIELLGQIASDVGMRAPTLRWEENTAISARAVISPLPWLPRIVIVSTGALECQSRENLRAMLAHEVGHLKLGHTKAYTLLRLLSRILMLGPGSLTGLIRTPDWFEAEADRFAVEWLEAHGGSREDLIAALTLTEQQRFLGLLHPQGPDGVGMHHGALADWLPPKLREVLAGAGALPWHRRVAGGWRLLYHLTMHAGLASYVHLPLPERVVIIRQLPRN